MSNKMTIKRTEKQSKKTTEENKVSPAKRRFDPVKVVPAVVVIVIWTLYFFISG